MDQPLDITYDGPLDIATGRSRKETSWCNRETHWSTLVARLSVTHHTAETLAEYMASKKARQDEIKDVGGFVGGYINGGRRKSSNILHRQLVTLDIDFAKSDTWADFMLLYENAALLYSTHKHAPDHARLRLVLPLDRPVRPDEYVAIARRVAGNLGINAFDDTTFEPCRLMYWPSTPKDGDYVFEYQDGPWLSADAILASYKNWRDASEWPVSDRAGEVIHREIKKQGDPLEKPGIVGAFCRTYNIHEAIETFLGDVYEPCNDGGRYTYKEGSTAAGLVTYDDLYAYSHHGTDPASGKLCNAFDLVRLHLYGLKDEDAKEGCPVNKLPSYTAMAEFAGRDSQTRKTLGEERLRAVGEDFGEALAVDEERPDNDWLATMDVDKAGAYRCTTDNIRIVLDNDPKLKGKFALNDFEKREVALANLPWRKIGPQTQYLCDRDDACLRVYLERVYGLSSTQKVKDAIDSIVWQYAFHPVRDYLNALSWDGQPRADTLLIDYLGAEDTKYTRAVTRKTLVAAVARIFRPGCKFDYVLVLVGKEGIGKSTIIKKLGRQWYSDSFGTVQGKEAYEQLQGVWLVEMGELAGLKKAERETIKHFITKCEDRYRVAYGRRIDNFPRQCVFFGTTNEADFLHDPTGNRRFWPVNVGELVSEKSLFTDLSDYEIGQIWAEAVSLFRAHEPLHLDKQTEELARQQQCAHSAVDDRVGLIEQYLGALLPANWADLDLFRRRAFLAGDELGPVGVTRRERVCVAEIWCELFGKSQADMGTYNTKDLHAIMKKMEGWEEAKFPVEIKGYGRQRVYRRTEKCDK